MAIETKWSGNQTWVHHPALRHSDERNATYVGSSNTYASSPLSLPHSITIETDDISRNQTVQSTGSTNSKWKAGKTGIIDVLITPLVRFTIFSTWHSVCLLSALLRRTSQYSIIEWMNVKVVNCSVRLRVERRYQRSGVVALFDKTLCWFNEDYLFYP